MKKRLIPILIAVAVLIAAGSIGVFKVQQKKAEKIALEAAAEEARQAEEARLAALEEAFKQAEEEATRIAEAEAEAKAKAEAEAEAEAKAKAEKEAAEKQKSGQSTTSKEKIIYLTFDDGPCAYTPELLAMLDEYGVKVTFFVTYNHKNCMDYITQASNAGHAIGVHTYSHVYSDIYSSAEAYWADFDKMQSIIKEKTGAASAIFRFPGGSSNLVSKKYCEGIMSQLAAESKEKGLAYFDWNVDSGDTVSTNSAENIAAIIEKGIESCKTPVVLQHDIKPKSIEATRMVIDWALEKGYKFGILTADGPICHHTIGN